MHTLILGRTASGKSILSKILAAEALERGQGVLVLDILGDEWPEGCVVTEDADEFLKLYWANFNCLCIIDEGGETANKRERKMIPTATRGRHNGHHNLYLAHRLTQLDPTLRAQCSRLFLFACATSDAMEMGDEFGAPELKEASGFPPGYLYFIEPGQRPRKLKINWNSFSIEEA